MNAALYHTEKISWCLNALFIDIGKWITTNCNYEVKPQIHNVAYNLKKNLWMISALSTEKMKIRCL